MNSKRILITTLILFVLVSIVSACRVQPAEYNRTASSDDSAIVRAFHSRTSNVQVEGEGVVERILADDLDGSRHQRFILRLASGQSILVAHNIDLAPRLVGLQVGDSVGFYGEYVWNSQGGTIHWTHHDPQGRHVTGWLKYKGQTYQ